jgi:hypothetical protein
MAAAIEVAELFSTLGLRIDKAAWGAPTHARAHAALARRPSRSSPLARSPAFSIGSAIKSGIAFNATLEDTRNQIAGMLSLAKHTDLADQLETPTG